MGNSRKNSSKYIDEMYLPKIKNSGNNMSPVLFLLSVFSALFIMLITAQPLIAGISGKNNNGTSANAFGILCSPVMGVGMDNRSSWESDGIGSYPLPNKSGRTWTVEEAFSAGATTVQYHGEGEGDFWVRDKAEPKGENYKNYASQYSDKLEERRTAGNCIGGVFTRLTNLGLGIANLVTGLAKFFAVTAFNTEFICSDPAKPTGNCFNLGKIIGGTGSQTGGIIGALTASIYLPLLVIAVTISAFWVAYIGFVKRKIREALFGVIWLIASVIVGLALLLNPSILSKGTISFSNAVSTCVIGAFNGENCMDASRTNATLEFKEGANTSTNICKSNVSGASISDTMLLRTNAITCSIWKAFVLEPLAHSSFGMSFNELDANTGRIKDSIEEAGLKSSDFCVDLYSSGSYNSMRDKTLTLTSNGGAKICNVLTYQMYLQVNAVSQSDEVSKSSELPRSGSIDDRWYKVVAVAAANDNTWSYWSGISGNLFMPLLAIITSALGTFIIIVTAIFALVYYIGTLILMAFAPIFFLFAVHPGRGKKLFLGWLEKIVTNLLKYLLSAVFLVATLAIYGAVLTDISNIGMTLLFVIVVTMALFMYRNELMGLLGRANMGGQQLSNAMSNKLGDVAQGIGGKTKNLTQKTANVGTAALAGTAGALVASGGIGSGVTLGDRLDAAKAGAKDSAKRSIRRQGGVLGNAVAQYERASTGNKQKLRSEEQKAQHTMIDAENDKKREEATLASATQSYDEAVANKESGNQQLEDKTEQLAHFREAEKETTEEMVSDSNISRAQKIREIESNPSLTAAEKEEKIAAVEAEHKLVVDFANYQNLSNAMHDAKMKLHIAEATGDTAAVEQYRNEINNLKPQKDALYASIGAQDASRMRHQYNVHLNEHLNDHGISRMDKQDFNEYVRLNVQNELSDDIISKAGQAKEHAELDLEATNAKYDNAKTRFNVYKSELENLRPGDTLKDSDLNNIERDLNDKLVKMKASDDDIKHAEDAVKNHANADEIPVVPFVKPVDGRLNTEIPQQNNDESNVVSANSESSFAAPVIPSRDNDDANAKTDSEQSVSSVAPSISNTPIPRRPDFPENEQRARDEEEFAAEQANELHKPDNAFVSPSAPVKTSSNSVNVPIRRPDFPENEQRARDEEEFAAEQANAHKEATNRASGIPTSPTSPSSNVRTDSNNPVNVPTRRPDFPENEQRARDEEEFAAEQAKQQNINSNVPSVSQATPIPTSRPSSPAPVSPSSEHKNNSENELKNEVNRARREAESLQNNIKNLNNDVNKRASEIQNASVDSRRVQEEQNATLKKQRESEREQHEREIDDRLTRAEQGNEEKIKKSVEQQLRNQPNNNSGFRSRTSSVSDEPPLSVEEEEMIQKDNKNDRREAMNRKASERRIKRSSENQNGEQLIWDSMEENDQNMQNEAMDESNDTSNNAPRVSGKPGNPQGKLFNSPDDPYRGLGRNQGRRGRVLRPKDDKDES